MKKSPSACDHNLLQTVVRTIGRHGMFTPGDNILAGVSGGPDSVALVHILVRLAERFSLSIGIAHLNHCLRGRESDRDARFVAELAKRMRLPCYSARKDVERGRQARKLSPEEAARRARYEFFEETAARHRFDKIALGHHADDNAELVLMYLLRGSGPVGISGIPPMRDGRYVRPMMDLNRRRIIEFLSENSISYITDSSNTDTRYLRNRIRHQLIPLLRNDYNPDISGTLNRLADILRAEESWLAATVRELFDRCLLAEDPDRVILSVPELRKMAAAPRRRVIRMAILRVKGNLRRIGLVHVDRLAMEILDGGSRGRQNGPPAGPHKGDPDRVGALHRSRKDAAQTNASVAARPSLPVSGGRPHGSFESNGTYRYLDRGDRPAAAVFGDLHRRGGGLDQCPAGYGIFRYGENTLPPRHQKRKGWRSLYLPWSSGDPEAQGVFHQQQDPHPSAQAHTDSFERR